MTNRHFRVATYARVSGEQQAKEDTIDSQLEAVSQRIASDALECDPELRFVDDGYSGTILARPGLERLRDQAAAGAIDRIYLHARPRPTLAQIYLSGPDPRRADPVRRRGRVPAQPRRPRPRAGPAAPGPGHDRRVRARQDHGALPKGQAARRTPRLGQRAQRRALWLPLRRQARGRRRGTLSGLGRRGPGRAEDLRVGRPGAVLHR